MTDCCDSNIKSKSTPLHLAAAEGHADACKLLCEVMENVNVEDDSGCTPLHSAAREGHTQVCRILCEAGAVINQHGKNIDTALHDAAC